MCLEKFALFICIINWLRKNQPILAIFVATGAVRDLLSDKYNIRIIFQLWIDYHAKMWKCVFQRNPIHIFIKQVISNISLFQQEIMFAHDCRSTTDQIRCKLASLQSNNKCWNSTNLNTEWITISLHTIITISRIHWCRSKAVMISDAVSQVDSVSANHNGLICMKIINNIRLAG